MAHYGVLIRVVGADSRRKANRLAEKIIEGETSGSHGKDVDVVLPINKALGFYLVAKLTDEQIDAYMDIRQSDLLSIGRRIVEGDNDFVDYFWDNVDEDCDVERCNSASYDQEKRELTLNVHVAVQGQWDYGSLASASWGNGLNPPDDYRFYPGKTKDCDVAGLLKNESSMSTSNLNGGKPVSKAIFNYAFVIDPDGISYVQYDTVAEALEGNGTSIPPYKDADDNDWLLVGDVHL